MTRPIQIVRTIAVLAVLLLLAQVAWAATPDPLQQPVSKGLAWLAAGQNLDPADPGSYGSWGAPASSCNNDERVLKTSFAVIKLIEQARERGQAPPAAAQAGIAFLMTRVQPDGSIWDYYDYTRCPESTPPEVAETGAAMAAIATTETPDAVVAVAGAPVANGKTYRWVEEQAAGYLAWAQRTADDSQYNGYDDQGGWTKGKDPDPVNFPDFISLPADQVDTGYATLGLISARNAFGIPVPQDLQDRLGIWIGNIQDPSGGSPNLPGSSYTGIHYTGDLLLEQYLIGHKAAPGSDVQKALDYIGANWAVLKGTPDTPGDSFGYYTLMSAFDLTGVDTLAGPGGSIDWFSDASTWMVNSQIPSGDSEGYWAPDLFGIPDASTPESSVLATEWSLLTLEGKTQAASMTVTASAQPPVVSKGQPAACTVKVTNTGQAAIYHLALAESSDSGTVFGLNGATPVVVTGDQDSILEPGEVWSFTASQNIAATTADTITATGNDLRGLPVSGTGSVTVTVNRPPVASSQQLVTNQDTPLDLTLVATDPDSDPLVYTAGAPAYGTLSGTAPDLTYTPNPGFYGSDSFTFSAFDGIDRSNPATVTITVNKRIVTINQPPVADDKSVFTKEDTPLGITLTATDPEGAPVTYQVVTPPAHGTLAGSAPVLTYTPALHYYGADQFTFKANDGSSDSNVATVSIAVVFQDHPPDTSGAAPSTSCLWPPNHKFADVTIAGVRDPDGDPISIVITKITSDEPSSSATGAGGKTHAPDATGVGTDTATLLRSERSGNNNGRVYAISFTASDGKGGVSPGTVTVCVPHDQSQKCVCVDDGQKYDATSIN
ncbi:MAG TPA: Ig-like domain-containing protein [Methanomicrobiales archaeon]|nr:Ig-like domain-containing protein [Methanomicrobiales archaeon]